MLTEVADGVLVHQSQLLRNNAVVVLGRSGVLLVDAGITTEEMTCLARDLAELGQPVVAGFSTHPDWDHVLWHEALGEATRYGTARCAEVLQQLRSEADWRDHAAAGLPPEIVDETPLDLYGLVTGLPTEATHFPWDGPNTRIVEHPAHSLGHAALLIEEAGVLIAGDMLSDVFIPMLNDVELAEDPIQDYLVGLRLLEDAVRNVDVVVPGHGSVAAGNEVRARIERDRAYVHALRDGREPDDPRITSPEPGWEWTIDIHAGQVRNVARSRRGGTPPD